MRNTTPVLTLIVLTLCAATTLAGDWPTWRGPARDDVSTETGLMKSWPEGGPKRVWLFDKAGLGYSSYSIADGKLFTMGAEGGNTFLLALDANTGKELWRTQVGQVLKNGWGDGPRSTPTYSDGLVYALGGRGDLVCVDAGKGTLKWRKSLTADFGGRTPGWGYSESPLVDGNKVVVTPGGKNGAVVALNKLSGAPLWRSSDFTEGAQYSSIIVAEHGGKKQYIQLTMKKLVGLDAEDGSVLWTSDWPGRTAVIPTPIYHDGHVYIASGYGVGSKLVKLNGSSAQNVWANTVMVNHHGGVILLDGHFFGYSDKGGWTAQSFKDGEAAWAKKGRGSLGKGAIAYADGRFYLLEEGSGTVALIAASSDDWEEHGRFKLDPQSTRRSRRGKVWAHPVIANGKLYLRDQEYIYCYDIKAK